MTKSLSLRFCLGLALALAGCTPPTSEWSAVEAPKKIQVDYVRLKHAAAFAPGSADFAQGEADDLAAFLDQIEVTPEDHVYFEAASDDRLAAARIGQLAHEIGQRGIGARTLPPSANDVPPDHMMVLVERYVVTPPDCPNWTKPATSDHSNTLPSNFGCADATNFSLMVADPRDMMIGRTLGPPEGDAALYGYQRYRQGKVKDPAPAAASTIYAPQAAGSGGGGGGAGGSGGGGQ